MSSDLMDVVVLKRVSSALVVVVGSLFISSDIAFIASLRDIRTLIRCLKNSSKYCNVLFKLLLANYILL